MLAIRLARVGRRKKPQYRIVVSEKTKDTLGDYLELLGTYNPHDKKAVLKEERINHWIKMGAQLSNSVNNLFIKEGLLKNGKKAKSVAISDKRRAKLDEAKKAAEPKPEVAPVAEVVAPAENTEAPSSSARPAEEKTEPSTAEATDGKETKA